MNFRKYLSQGWQSISWGTTSYHHSTSDIQPTRWPISKSRKWNTKYTSKPQLSNRISSLICCWKKIKIWITTKYSIPSYSNSRLCNSMKLSTVWRKLCHSRRTFKFLVRLGKDHSHKYFWSDNWKHNIWDQSKLSTNKGVLNLDNYHTSETSMKFWNRYNLTGISKCVMHFRMRKMFIWSLSSVHMAIYTTK